MDDTIAVFLSEDYQETPPERDASIAANFGERRMIASVLQRALIDALQMFNKIDRIVEIEGGEYEDIDLGLETPSRRKYVGKSNEKWKARQLIRWFHSNDESPFSFLWILDNLGLAGYRDNLRRIIEEDTMEDYPHLQNMI